MRRVTGLLGTTTSAAMAVATATLAAAARKWPIPREGMAPAESASEFPDLVSESYEHNIRSAVETGDSMKLDKLLNHLAREKKTYTRMASSSLIRKSLYSAAESGNAQIMAAILHFGHITGQGADFVLDEKVLQAASSCKDDVIMLMLLVQARFISEECMDKLKDNLRKHIAEQRTSGNLENATRLENLIGPKTIAESPVASPATRPVQTHLQ